MKKPIFLALIGIAAVAAAVTVSALRLPGALGTSENENKIEDAILAATSAILKDTSSFVHLHEKENEYIQPNQDQLRQEHKMVETEEMEGPEQDVPAANAPDSPIEEQKEDKAEEGANEATKAQNEPQNASEGTNPTNPDVLSDTSTNYGEDTTGDTEEHPAPSGFTQEELDWMNSMGFTTGGNSTTGVIQEVYIDPNAGQNIEMNGTWY